MTTEPDPALLPCPFCRSAEFVAVTEEDPTGPWWVGCAACAMQGPVSAESAEDARRLWNTRAAPEGPVVWIARQPDHALDYGHRMDTSPMTPGPDGVCRGGTMVAPDALMDVLRLAPGECAAFRLVRVDS